MARTPPGPGEMLPRGAGGEVEPIAGRMMKGSFAVVGTLKAPAGFTVYTIRFKVRREKGERVV